MRAPQNQPRRTIVYGIRTTAGLILGIASLVLAVFSFSPASEAKATKRQSRSFALTPRQSIPVVPNGTTLTNDSISPAFLEDVVCISSIDCWAVGYRGTVSETLIEHWNGSNWSIVPSPNPEGRGNQLHGVTCVTATDCWAVGATVPPVEDGTQDRTLIEHWNGVSWTVIPSPNVNTLHNRLFSVTCSSASQCWAVGNYSTASGFSNTLIQRWDGVSWEVVTSSNIAGPTFNTLADVTCASATNCWAVGSYNNSGITRTLIQRWNGTSWSIVASPNGNTSAYNLLTSVTCISESDCFAVGYYLKASPEAEQTLIERWNGATWTIVTSANTASTDDNRLYAVSCTSSTDCWAAGNFAAGSGSGTLIEHWNGSAWAKVPSPVPNSPNDYPYGVSCVSTSDCWAVGITEEGPHTLTEHWNGIAWSVFPSLTVTGITRSSDGVTWMFSIDGRGPASSQITIKATSDLKQPFVTVDGAESDSSGDFHYGDSGPVSSQPQFYRATFP